MVTVWMIVLAWVGGVFLQNAVPWTGLYLCLGATLLMRTIPNRQYQWLVIACVLGTCRMAWYQWMPYAAQRELHNARVTVIDVKATWQEQRIQARGTDGYGYVFKIPPEPLFLRGIDLCVSGNIRPFAAGHSSYEDGLIQRHIIGEVDLTTNPTVMSTKNWLVSIEHLRIATQQRIHGAFREPIASVVVGMLLGIGGDVSPNIARAFRTSGTSHILVISGWNITIVAALCQLVVRACRMRGVWPLIIPLCVISVYVVFTGASAAVVRAGYMGAVMVIGKWLDRPRDMWNIIACAVWLMSVFDPTTLWDLGFQLSTGATIGLIGFGSHIDNALNRTPFGKPELSWAREGLSATMAAQIPTLPIMLCRLGTPSPWTFLANIILTPIVPYAMASGALTTLVAWPSPDLASIVAWCAIPAYAWIIDGSLAIAQLPAPFQMHIENVWVEYVLHLLWIMQLLRGKSRIIRPQ